MWDLHYRHLNGFNFSSCHRTFESECLGINIWKVRPSSHLCCVFGLSAVYLCTDDPQLSWFPSLQSFCSSFANSLLLCLETKRCQRWGGGRFGLKMEIWNRTKYLICFLIKKCTIEIGYIFTFEQKTKTFACVAITALTHRGSPSLTLDAFNCSLTPLLTFSLGSSFQRCAFCFECFQSFFSKFFKSFSKFL